jgi:hypothetical protein
MSVAAGMCLPSRCSEMAMVYLPILWSLHSNGSTRYCNDDDDDNNNNNNNNNVERLLAS